MSGWPDSGGLFPEGQVEEPVVRGWWHRDPALSERVAKAQAADGLRPVVSVVEEVVMAEIRAACAEQRQRVAERRAKPWL